MTTLTPAPPSPLSTTTPASARANAPATTPATPASRGQTAAQMLVTHDAGDRFAIEIRGHTVVVDQPEAVGGDDEGPTPTELFVASLASCVGFYARRYLARHRLDATGLRVEVDWDMATKPSRVGEVTLRVVVPGGVPEERRAGLLAQASHCTVHKTLRQPPPVTIDLT